MLNFDSLSSLGMTASAPTQQSALNALCGETSAIRPGVYGRGLITILDDAFARPLLTEWVWLVSSSSIPFAVTGFGDVFIFDHENGVRFLEVQAAHLEFVDFNASWVVSEFIARPEVVEKVLRATNFEALVTAHRAIRYGEVFILRPWEMLGGDRRSCLYDIGKLSVYLDLVGQTARQVLHPLNR